MRQFGLLKRVYIAHRFCLALLDEAALNPRFDVVEAWKNGPVIPSVYHSFKQNKSNPITEKSVIAEWQNGQAKRTFPEIGDGNDSVKDIANDVWEKHLNFSDAQMVELLHRKGTPWALCYEEGKTIRYPAFTPKRSTKRCLEYDGQKLRRKH